MKIVHRKGDIIKAKQDVIVFPTGVYDRKRNGIFGQFLNIHIGVKNSLLYDMQRNLLNIGSLRLLDYGRNDYVAALIVFFNYNNNILKDNDDDRLIDYDYLYESLNQLREYVINKGLFKMSICIDDFIDIGCDENIFEAMLKSIFKDIPVNIIIYGKLQ